MKINVHVDSKRDDIIKAAIYLFSEKGINGISVKEIGSRAGVFDAALYKHFPSETSFAENPFGLLLLGRNHYCMSEAIRITVPSVRGKNSKIVNSVSGR